MLGRRDLALGAPLALLASGCGSRSGAARGPGTATGGEAAGAPGAPEPAWGVQSGDVSATRALLWSRSDRPSVMSAEWSLRPDFAGSRAVAGPRVGDATDLTGNVGIGGLPAGSHIHYRVRFTAEAPSPWVTGSLVTPDAADARDPRDVVFVWSGDTNGQGWGIDEARGGMPAFAAAAERAPDFFLSCGDAIYADDPIPPEKKAGDGSTWRNVVTADKSRGAETLADFRGAHRYPRLSREVRALSAKASTFAIWDDHEVRNNWFPGGPGIDALAPRALRAFAEYTPTLAPMVRSARWGPHLEVFFLDGRSFRTANHPVPEHEAFLGSQQLAWLEGALAASTATWKVIASDMPVGLVVSEPAPGAPGVQAFDGFANQGGAASGRELELAHLFASLRARRVKNVVWLTADVHYAAAHRYDPSRAAFKDLDPFWEFVAGPMHAAAFPRKPFDDTFGPELAYASAGWDTYGSPATGQQYFGVVRIEGRTGVMRVTLVDARGRDLFAIDLTPWGSARPGSGSPGR
ncbi:MAG: secreted alkaline phosphatase [Labilithrix sp.]|nr:secreted alkaline phosphatase [Labilithrix sp.]